MLFIKAYALTLLFTTTLLHLPKLRCQIQADTFTLCFPVYLLFCPVGTSMLKVILCCCFGTSFTEQNYGNLIHVLIVIMILLFVSWASLCRSQSITQMGLCVFAGPMGI